MDSRESATRSHLHNFTKIHPAGGFRLRASSPRSSKLFLYKPTNATDRPMAVGNKASDFERRFEGFLAARDPSEFPAGDADPNRVNSDLSMIHEVQHTLD